MKILIIEDDVNIARLIELELGYEGYQVSVAHEGNHGIELFKKDQPDLVLARCNVAGTWTEWKFAKNCGPCRKYR